MTRRLVELKVMQPYSHLLYLEVCNLEEAHTEMLMNATLLMMMFRWPPLSQ